MEKILSVSVASYNVEKFIVQNMESFLGTEVSSKIEVLIIDDGSKDNTADIALEYQNKYPETIKLIKQKNAGPGSTVNTGIINATGKYFRMVDGDDWVNTQDLVKFINFLENNDVDVVYTDYCLVDNETSKKVPQRINFYRKNEVLDYTEICDKIDVVMHNVTYKTSILKNNNIILDNCFYTDMEYLLYPVKYINTVAILDCLIYMYRVSLSTQSVNINSMIRNKEMHNLVLTHLIEDYKNSLTSGIMSRSKEKFILKRLNEMCGTRLSIILAQKPSKYTKNELKEFVLFLKESNDELYNMFMNFRTMKLLNHTNYLLFSRLSLIHRRKEGVK